MVRAKFRVDSITESLWNSNGREISLVPHYDSSIPEDQSYAKYTPSGSIKMFVDNPAALAEFTMGKFFYIDFTAIEG